MRGVNDRSLSINSDSVDTEGRHIINLFSEADEESKDGGPSKRSISEGSMEEGNSKGGKMRRNFTNKLSILRGDAK